MNPWLLSLFSTLLLVSCTGVKVPPQEQVIVRVGSEELNSKQFAKEIMRRAKTLDAVLVQDPNIVQRVKNDAIKEFMVRAFLKNWAKSNEIAISEAELNTEVERLQKNYPNSSAFIAALTKEGLSLEEWKYGIHMNLLERRLFQQLRATFSAPTESEMQVYYDHNKDKFKKNKAVKVRQIVIDTEDGAKQIMKEIKKGKPFGKLAEKYSISPEGKKGGETEWIDTETLEVYEEAYNLRPGATSPILKSPYGFHIMELMDKRQGGQPTFKDVKDNIKKILMESKEQAAFSQWLEEQIRKNKVYRNDPLIAAVKVATENK